MVFKEEQRFTQWWLWLILIGIGMIPIGQISFVDKAVPGIGIIISSVFIYGLITLFFFIKLKTEVNQDGIRMNFSPFINKRIKWDEIKNAEIVNYGFVGGWGIRLGTKYGTVYNIRGDEGLAIELKNGDKFLIGTQKKSKMNKVVSMYLQRRPKVV